MAASATRISRPSTNRAPRNANPGQEGEERWIWLRLKLIADAGLVGLPNAGKSTFLSAVSAAKPKIADYPFTTLHPQLGVVDVDGREFVLADIPGLIEGAHEGAGLGDRFLGHVERCRVLLHLVDATCEHAGKAYKTVRTELEAYEGQLADKIEIVALNKIDAVTPDELKKQKDRLKRAAKKTPLLMSGVTGEGVKEALRALVEVIGEAPVSVKAKGAAQAEPWAPDDAAGLTSPSGCLSPTCASIRPGCKTPISFPQTSKSWRWRVSLSPTCHIVRPHPWPAQA